MSNCNKCKKSVNRRDGSGLACSICNQLFHKNCVNVKQTDLNFLKSQSMEWKCMPCTKSAQTPSSPLPLLRSESVNREVKEGDSDFYECAVGGSAITAMPESNSLTETLENILASLKIVHDKLDGHSERFSKLESNLTKALEDVKILQDSHDKLVKENNDLRNRVEDLEQTALEKSLEIKGVPVSSGENLSTTVISTVQKLGIELKPECINKIYRYGPVINNTRTIVVDMIRKGDRDEILAQRRVRRDFQINNNIIYLNEALTPFRRRLLGLARAAKKKASDFKFVWVKNGMIFARKDPNSKIFRVSSEEDIQKII